MAMMMLRISCYVDAVTKIGYSSHPVFKRSVMMDQPESKNCAVMNRKYFEGVEEITAVMHHPTVFDFLVCHDVQLISHCSMADPLTNKFLISGEL